MQAYFSNFRMKSNPQLGILIYGLVLVFSSFEIEARLGSIVPPQCDPEYKGTMPPNIEFLCKSIAKLWDSNNVEDDSDQNGKKFLGNTEYLFFFLLMVYLDIFWTWGIV